MARHETIAHTAPGDGVAAAIRDWKAPAFFAALTALFFHRILLGEAWLWEDMMYYSYPVRVFAATSMAMGHIPLWNPYTFGGMPFLADIQTTVLYLPCALLALAVRDGTLGFWWLEAMVIAHYVLAGWAMYLFGAGLGLKRAAALLAGASYMLSGFMITHAIHQQIITMVAWYPLIALLFQRSMEPRAWRSAFGCALVLGHSTLAGYPQLSLYFHAFLLAYFIFLVTGRYPGKALLERDAFGAAARAALIVGAGLAVAAVQLLPTNELADLSQRAQITYEKSTEGSLVVPQLLTLFQPKLFGAAGAGGNTYWGPGTYWYFWETCIYIGILPLMLALLSLLQVRRRRDVAFFWGVALFAVLFALGNNFILHPVVQRYVPGFSKFRDPARMAVLFSLAASLLAGIALQALLAPDAKAAHVRLSRRWVFGIAGAGALLWLGVTSGILTAALGMPAAPALQDAVRTDAHWSLLFVAGSAAALLAALSRRLREGTAALVLPLLICADMYVFGGAQNTSPNDPGEYFRRSAPLVRFLRNDMRSGLFRVNTRNQYGMLMDRNQGMVDRIFTLEGYTPLVLQRANPPFTDTQRFDLLNVKYRTAADTRTNGLTIAPNPTFMPRAFVLYRDRVSATEEELLAAIRDSTWDHRTTVLLEEPPPILPVPPPAGSGPTAQVTDYGDNRIVIDAGTPTDGILVLSEMYYPGWTATVDGAPAKILRADYTLRAIALPAGSHRVVFDFMPPPFVAGVWISGAAIVTCLAGIALPSLRARRRGEKGR